MRYPVADPREEALEKIRQFYQKRYEP